MIKINLFFILLFAAYVIPIGGVAAAVDPPRVQIVFYQRGYTEGSSDPPTVTTRQAIDLFEKDNSDIQVQIVGIPYSEDGDKRFEAALSSRTVDIVRLTSAQLPRYARRGLLSEIDPWLTSEDRNDFYPAALQAASYRGRIYAWPLWVTAVTVIANAELLNERKIKVPSFDAPWTFKRFAAVCGKLSFERKDGPRVRGLAFGAAVPALFYIDGGRVLSPDGKEFWGNRPRAVSALTKLVSLEKKNHCLADDFLAADEPQTRDEFERGRVAMLLSPPGYIRILAAKRFPFIVLPIPIGDTGVPVTTGAFGLYSVIDTGDAARIAAAHRLARWLTSSAVGSSVVGYQLAPGLRRSNKNLDGDLMFAPIAKAVRYGVYEVPTEVPDAIQRVGLAEAMRSAIFGDVPPQKAMDIVAPIYQSALDATNL